MCIRDSTNIVYGTYLNPDDKSANGVMTYDGCIVYELSLIHIQMCIRDSYYIEEDKNLTEITQDNSDNYILPIFGTACPEFGSINPYANGEYFIVDKGYSQG